MSLLELFSYYEDDVNEPIPYKRFEEYGWSKDGYLYYLSSMERIRSAMILCSSYCLIRGDSPWKRINMGERRYRDLSRAGIEDLRNFLLNFDSEIPEFSKITDSLFSGEVWVSNFCGRFSVLPDKQRGVRCDIVYKSLASVRMMIEYGIYDTLKHGPSTGEIMIENYDDLNNRSLEELKNELSNLEFKQMEREPDSEPDCSSYEAIQRWAEKMSDYINTQEELVDEISAYEEVIEIKEKSIYSPKRILYVHKGDNIVCNRENHDIFSVKADLPTITGEKISINVNYCNNCNKLFISKNEYDHYRTVYPGLLANVRFVDENFMENTDFAREEYSILALNGYTVRKDGPDLKTRHKILKNLIDEGIIQKHQVIKHLEMLINTNGRKNGMQSAVGKWEKDLEFVRAYHFEEQPTYEIEEVRKYSK